MRQGGVAAPADALEGAHVERDPFRAPSTSVVDLLLLLLVAFPLRLPAAANAADEGHGEADDDGARHEDARANLGRRDVELHQVEPPLLDLRDAGVVAGRALGVFATHDEEEGACRAEWQRCAVWRLVRRQGLD